jgi:hypothetical protein
LARQLDYRLPPLGGSAARRAWNPGVAAAVLAAVAIGIIVAVAPMLGFIGGIAVLALAIAYADTLVVERVGGIVLLGGAMVLGYGFANLGVRLGPVPLPATEILLAPLALIAVAHRRTRLDGAILLPVCLFAILVVIRLAFDYPVWGIFAVRDSTLAIEMFILLVGYRAVMRDGLAAWIRRLRWIFLAVLAAGLLEPFQATIKALSPTVGLQRATPLFDTKGVKFSVIAGGLFFVIFGWKLLRPVLLGIVTGLVGIFQARTLYLMFPISFAALAWLSRRGTQIVSQFVPAALLGIVMLVAAASLSIQGTEGEISTEFFTAHVRTLLGEEGPNAATIEARESFFQQTLSFVAQSPGTVLVGVGLGPDLTFGQWVAEEGQLVRNPHDAYLEVYARTGLLGFVLFMWVLIACMTRIGRHARRGHGATQLFCSWAFAACLVYLGVAAAQPILAFPYGSVPLFFFLGMGLAAAKGPVATAPANGARVLAAR